MDPSSDQLHHRLLPDWSTVADRDDAEVLAYLSEDIRQKSVEMGAESFVRSLEDSLSNVLLMGERQTVTVGDFQRALDRLYEKHVEGTIREPQQIVPFVTHLPVYSLRAAATKFGEDMEVEAEDWIAAPTDMRISEEMFAAHVVGRSMEPKIPDGSLCVFRQRVVGSRQGKLLLIWRRGASEGGGEFTIKRYSSRKKVTEEGWSHESIRLEPLNPEFEAWDLEGEEFRVLGEFLRVLPLDEE